MHACPVLHSRGEQRDERRLDEAPLVMALLRPGVGEEHVHAIERVRSDHVLDHLDRVVLDDAKIREMQIGDAFQETADARGMHLDSEIVALGTRPWRKTKLRIWRRCSCKKYLATRPSAGSGPKPASWGWRSRAFSACVRRERLRARLRRPFSSPAPSAPGSAPSRPRCS